MPASPYILFCKEKRPQVKADNPGIAFGDIAKKLGEMWKNLSEEEKKPYIEKAEAEKAEHKDEPKEKKSKCKSKCKSTKKSKKEDSEKEESEKEESGSDDE
ncbi:HMG box family protein [Trichomonas vaginalis G3]|uniref:HMG box family protein n=1 Tax=Trichomonas vaginalis (strain ATCC PRA-98 / G3) TaxID=412133 RepID=A2EUN9_TRIV3|nr:DNA binding [Trichomonas vaginalis G3]EAY03627.1 HMG box family protein [Trichomonas vaginalis G3]KAI5524722.1 DNA binding [Trichomonas vaginalis G3]|eukprot:XP_001315850.1 HMG box family protein [Trichomonas vaginalis G3]